MAELIPVILPDEGEAGSAWRHEKCRDFHWRAKCMGLEQDPAILQLLEKISESTADLEKMWEDQRANHDRRWWQDGEYDADRADVANDRALELFKLGKHADAFASFTEAIRLCPSSAVYHCNRAAVALKLNRPAIAAEDADNALERDPRYLKAALRAGNAYIRLKDPERAEQRFKAALGLDKNSMAAQRGMIEVGNVADRIAEEDAINKNFVRSGSRAALPRCHVDLEDAALQLLAATQILNIRPKEEAAKCSKAEALILCGRYEDALCVCDEMLPGLERQYFTAEALWRSGFVGKAVNTLLGIASDVQCDKCITLLEFIKLIHKELAILESALEDGVYLDAEEACCRILALLTDASACTGLYCKILRSRAQSFVGRQRWEAALEDLNQAIELNCSDVDALRTRAHVNKLSGRHFEYFFDIKRLQKLLPGDHSLRNLLEGAALLCTSGYSRKGVLQQQSIYGPESALRALGLEHKASLSNADVRKKYLKLAAAWHPDKWSTAAVEDQAAAEARFKSIQSAYESLITT